MLIAQLVYLLTVFQVVLCYQQLTQSKLQSFIDSLNTTTASLQSHFTHFNRTRVPGTEGSLYIRDYIQSHFEKLNKDSDTPWLIEHDTFEEKGYNFSNIIVTKQARYGGDKYLVLSAHYDSLIKPEGFIGAIDSSVSCSILLNLAEDTNHALDTSFSQNDEYELGLKIIFFDGEEAFEKWSHDDSIYGSRHLHQKWSKQNKLNDLELFVLLDLLGAEQNHIPSYFPQTHDKYNELSGLETRLGQLSPSLFSFQDKYLDTVDAEFKIKFQGYMEDDHLPFLRSGVPVLHLIPSNFPKNWHTIDDDFSNVDLNAALKWDVLLKAFALEYLEIAV